MDHLKNCHPKLEWGDNSSGGISWGDNSTGGISWGDNSTGGSAGVIILQVIQYLQATKIQINISYS